MVAEADFSGYATKAGLKCSDGRTIMPDAFKHQDKMQVPLVWQHGHTDPENVLGHAILENRGDGVYTYGFFNKSAKAVHAKLLVEHKDIKALSIWANDLIERSGKVLHGAIREVSLVLSGANPGAVIENVMIRHSDGDEVALDNEVIIHTGLEFEHTTAVSTKDDTMPPVETEEETVQDILDSMSDKQKAAMQTLIDEAKKVDDKSPDDAPTEEKKEDKVDNEFIQKVYETLNDEQKEVLHFMLGEALVHADTTTNPNETVQDVVDSMTDKQKQVMYFMIGQALDDAGATMQQDNMNDTSNKKEEEGSTTMTHNVFEKGEKPEKVILSHADVEGIVADAMKGGSLKDAVENYAIAHNITDIDTLFPDAKTVVDAPEFFRRRMEWANQLLSAVRKSPFTRIKTVSADLTLEDARAKGYVKGTLKKEEFFGVTKRVTTPSTIYKKQTLDRDDVLDITDFDVVTWLKGEMRIMLDEELARAILFGDGRDIADADKINEQNIRPIAKDHELYVTTVNVNIGDVNSSINEVMDAIIANRKFYRGSGMPTLYTTEQYISMFMMVRDTTGRRVYRSLDEVAMELRVAAILPVEAMEDEADLVAIIVNPVDYIIGADKGGNVSLFDDFDIDYNQYKYLIETRVSGALVKLKSAIVVRKTAGTNVVVTPATPAFDPATGALTITNQTGVVYKHGATTLNAAGSPYTVPNGQTWVVDATPAAGYYFETSEADQWSFTNPA